MHHIILGILFVVMASDPIQASYHNQREYRDEYTSDRVFIRVLTNLTQVPDDIPDEAVEVNLRYNMITDIPINAFSNLRQCRHLRLARNQLSVIEPGMFNGLDSLLHLSLRFNKITDIPIDAFSNLRDCQYLGLTTNQLSVIKPGMFNGLDSLLLLYLSYNMITDISIDAFSNLQDCQRLDISYNEISRIEPGMFNGLNSLTELNLYSNKIITLGDDSFSGLTSLQVLYLHDNRITTIPDKMFSSLKTWHLNFNRVSAIPGNTFSNLSNCVELGLENNPIENIEAGAFHGLDKLTILRLSGTSLTHLSQNMFQGLPSLKHLRLYQSKISEIARGAFTGLDQLLSLQLNQTELTALEFNTFSGLVSLKELYLHQNNITDIKAFAFVALGNLSRLYLYNNQLEHLRANAFAGLVSLESLDLGHNKLTTLDPLVLSPLPRPLELAMDSQQSSIVCDVNLCWLKVEEEFGNIVWNSHLSVTGRTMYFPNCTGGADWQSLLCPATILCSDPGQVEFAERSGYFLPLNNNAQPGLDLPYSTDSEFTYTCDPCYTGGGTITCQSNGQWTRKPECVRLDNKVICIAPALENGYLTPSSEQYECGVAVTFTCDEGFTLSGPPDGTCGPDGQFVGDISSCVKNDSSGSIYGMVGAAVGGMVLMAFIGLTIFGIKRSKKNNPSYANTARSQDTVTDGGYIGIVTDGNNGATDAGYIEPIARGTPGRTDDIVYSNTAYENDGASEARYIEPIARGTPGQTVRSTGHEPGYRNHAYEHEYQEIADALPNNNLYDRADVDEDTYEN